MVGEQDECKDECADSYDVEVLEDKTNVDTLLVLARYVCPLKYVANCVTSH